MCVCVCVWRDILGLHRGGKQHLVGLVFLENLLSSPSPAFVAPGDNV